MKENMTITVNAQDYAYRLSLIEDRIYNAICAPVSLDEDDANARSKYIINMLTDAIRLTRDLHTEVQIDCVKQYNPEALRNMA